MEGRRIEIKKEENKNQSKLDPNLLPNIQLNKTTNMTILRRRAGVSSSTFRTLEPQLPNINHTSTYLANAANDNTDKELLKTKKQEFNCSSENYQLKLKNELFSTFNEPEKHTRKGAEAQLKDKIFSITSSIVLCSIMVGIIGIVSLAILNNKPTLLVNAHYSSSSSSSANTLGLPSQTTTSTSPLKSNGFSSIGTQQQKLNQAPKSFVHKHHQATMKPTTITGNNNEQVSNNLDYHTRKVTPSFESSNSRYNSIDRFDSGEQIRPPLLRTPTTLPPLTVATTSSRRPNTITKPQQQVSTVSHNNKNNYNNNNNQLYNLETAASQDSYLSPEDREQFLRNQENHYEGKGGSDQLDSYGPAGTNPQEQQEGGDRYDHHPQSQQQSNNRWAQPDINNQISDVVSAKSSNNFERQNQLRLSENNNNNNNKQAEGGVTDGDDGDYDDENPEVNKRGSNLVPENRRVGTGASHNYLNNQKHFNNNNNNYQNNPTLTNNLESVDENELTDDYGSANDEVHFSRKPNNKNDITNPNVNPSASYNREHRNRLNNDYNQLRNTRYGNSENSRPSARNNDHSEQHEAHGERQGFGPGPNEAYLVDRAESGAGRGYNNNNNNSPLDNGDDEQSLYAPNGTGGGDIESDMDNRRSMNDRASSRLTELPAQQSHQIKSQLGNNNPNLRPILNNVDNNSSSDDNNGDPDNDSDDSSDSNEADNLSSNVAGPAFAPSYKTEVTSRSKPIGNANRYFMQSSKMQPIGNQAYNANTNYNINNVVRTSASAPAPLSTPNPTNNNKLMTNFQPKYSLPLSVHLSNRANTINITPNKSVSSSKIFTNSNDQNNIQHQQKPLLSTSEHKSSSFVGQQTAPKYDPQSNPSHAGKYFID